MRRLPLLAPFGALVFTVAWLVLGAISPGYRLFDLVIDGYSPISQPVSGLGLGVTGPWMNAAFIIGGALMLVGTWASAWLFTGTRLGTAAWCLIAFLGVGMIIDGVFTLESVMLHLLGFLLAVPLPAVGFALGAVALWKTQRDVAIWLAVAAPAAIALFVLFMVIFDPYSAGSGEGFAGLVQRILITAVLATVSMVGITAARIFR